MKAPTKVTIAFILSLSASAFADNTISRVYLARVNALLERTHMLIQKAQENADVKTSEQFNYPALESDINQIQDGITNYINQIQINPNQLIPINANFTE